MALTLTYLCFSWKESLAKGLTLVIERRCSRSIRHRACVYPSPDSTTAVKYDCSFVAKQFGIDRIKDGAGFEFGSTSSALLFKAWNIQGLIGKRARLHLFNFLRPMVTPPLSLRPSSNHQMAENNVQRHASCKPQIGAISNTLPLLLGLPPSWSG